MIAADARGYAAREELFGALRTQLPWGSVPPLRTPGTVFEEVGYHKPDARVFARALQSLGCAGDEVWFVGDHPRNDIVGAAAAGLRRSG